MAKFKENDNVIHTETNEVGIVVKIHPPARARQLYTVNFSGIEKTCSEGNLISNYNIADPVERIRQGQFGSNLEFVRINTTNKLINTTNNTISSLKASKSLFRAYQFKPLLKFLNSDNRRLLIADEVGLGKTIEAGHIMFELYARREMNNAIIVCPKSLQEKWRSELKDKFNFTFKVYESVKELIADIQDRSTVVKAIINYEKIRYNDSDTEKEKQSLLTVVSERRSEFDLVIFDEAHKLRNRDTQTYKGAKSIIENSKAVIFLTATPIMISVENLFNLLQLLNPIKYSSYGIFCNNLQINKPFLSALNRLSNNESDLCEIAEELNNAEVLNPQTQIKTTVGELFANIPIYNEIIKNLNSLEDSISLRVQIQFDITSLNQMNSIFTRTRKRDITTDWSQAIRDPHTWSIKLNDNERMEFDRIIEEYIEDNGGYSDEYTRARLSSGQALGLVQRKRQIASSVYGFLNTIDDLNNGIDAYSECEDAKFSKLMEIVDEIVKSRARKLIVFALFKNTLKYLAIRLQKEGLNTAVIHGDIKDRDEILYSFKNDVDVQILLSSEVGSEGLDLQFCDSLVNYDLPWNPMVVEQRIGRIDRFGQESPRVHIYNLVVSNSIQEQIYSRLLDRIGIFRGSIGDLEAILDEPIEREDNKIISLREYFNSIEKDLYCNEYTEEERNKKIESIERAIATERRNLHQIESGLTNTLTNDSYFENEIRRIQKNYRYITDRELLLYVKSIVRDCLTTCNIKETEDDCYIFSMLKSAKKELINFLTKYQPVNDESNIIFNQFKNQIADLSEFKLTFNQEQAYKDKKLIYINIYHPIVVAIFKYYQAKKNIYNTTFRFYIDAKKIDSESEIVAGEYYLAIYNYSLIFTSLGRSTRREIIRSVIYDRNNEKIISDKDICDEFMGKSQVYASVYDGLATSSSDDIDIAYPELACAIEDLVTEEFNKAKVELDSNKIMETQRIEEYYNYCISEQESKIRDEEIEWLNFYYYKNDKKNDEKKHRQKIAGHKAKITRLQRQLEEDKEKIKDNNVKYELAQLISLNQVIIK